MLCCFAPRCLVPLRVLLCPRTLCGAAGRFFVVFPCAVCSALRCVCFPGALRHVVLFAALR